MLTAPAEAILVGAGNRGNKVGRYAMQHPESLRIAGVVEPDQGRLQYFRQLLGVPERSSFRSVEELLESGMRADAAINTSMDSQHKETTLPLLDAGYVVLLEKPIATSAGDVSEICNSGNSGNLVIFQEMRYTPVYSRVAEIVMSGELGEILNISHREQVGNQHFVHSFVRGQWRREEDTAPITLTKMCHDYDYIAWIAGRPLLSVTASRQDLHYTAANAPPGAAERCLDCVIGRECQHYAPEAYLGEGHVPDSMRRALSVSLSRSEIADRVEKGMYGRCAYHCDNDVPDETRAALQFEGGLSAELTMTAQPDRETRLTFIQGSRGSLFADFLAGKVSVNMGDGWRTVLTVSGFDTHGGGDECLLGDFISFLKGGPSYHVSARESATGHYIAFCAAEAMKTGKTIDFREYSRDFIR